MFSLLIGYFTDLIFRVFLHGYVSNGYVFPKPLSADEEREYLNRMQNGDEKARDILIEHNLRLVAHIAKKYSSASACDTDDLISIGTIGLIKAIDSFDKNKNIRLATYASRCIANEILMVIRASKNRQREISLQDPIGTDAEGNTISLLNVVYNEDEDIDDEILLKIQTKKLYDAIEKRLAGREKDVIRMRYGLCEEDCMTQREIAKKLHISRSYVSRIETKAIEKLRCEFNDEER